jgi:hypothetical protein
MFSKNLFKSRDMTVEAWNFDPSVWLVWPGILILLCGWCGLGF